MMPEEGCSSLGVIGGKPLGVVFIEPYSELIQIQNMDTPITQTQHLKHNYFLDPKPYTLNPAIDIQNPA